MVARAGRVGRAITLVTPGKELSYFRNIEKAMGGESLPLCAWVKDADADEDEDDNENEDEFNAAADKQQCEHGA